MRAREASIIATIVNQLPEVPYSLEIPNLERVKALGYLEHARRCLKKTKEYSSTHPREQSVVRGGRVVLARRKSE